MSKTTRSSRAIASTVLFLFAVIWPVDLLLSFQLARSGRVVTGIVEDTSEGRAKSGQVIHYSTVSYPGWGMTLRRTLSGPALQIGENTVVQYPPLLPLYAVLDDKPQPPPATVTIVMRLIIGAIFSGVAVLILRNG